MEDGENRISFIKDIYITDRKDDTIYSALSNGIEKCGGVESLGGLGSDETRIITGHKKVASKLKQER